MTCTGDTCADCANPEETAQSIMALGCPIIAGNCEDSLGNGALDCGCGFEEGSPATFFPGNGFLMQIASYPQKPATGCELSQAILRLSREESVMASFMAGSSGK